MTEAGLLGPADGRHSPHCPVSLRSAQGEYDAALSFELDRRDARPGCSYGRDARTWLVGVGPATPLF